MASKPYYPYPYVVVVQYHQQPQYQQPPQAQADPNQPAAQNNRNRGKKQQKQRKPERRIDQIHMPYYQLFLQFLNFLLVQFIDLGPPPTPFPLGYDANARCEFHLGAPGYTVENCRALKHKVQDLTDLKAIIFTPDDLNVLFNHMPPQTSTTAIP